MLKVKIYHSKVEITVEITGDTYDNRQLLSKNKFRFISALAGSWRAYYTKSYSLSHVQELLKEDILIGAEKMLEVTRQLQAELATLPEVEIADQTHFLELILNAQTILSNPEKYRAEQEEWKEKQAKALQAKLEAAEHAALELPAAQLELEQLQAQAEGLKKVKIEAEAAFELAYPDLEDRSLDWAAIARDPITLHKNEQDEMWDHLWGKINQQKDRIRSLEKIIKSAYPEVTS